MTTPTTPDVEQERAAFEAWCIAERKRRGYHGDQGNLSIHRAEDDDGNEAEDYLVWATTFAWWGWQAARQHSATQLAALTEELSATQAQRNASNREIERLRDEVEALDQKLAAAEAREAKLRAHVANHSQWQGNSGAVFCSGCNVELDGREQHDENCVVVMAQAPSDRTALDQMLAEARDAASADFKNFHRSLCERFGYSHDPVDWKRDLVSLEEHIASRLTEARRETRAACAADIFLMTADGMLAAALQELPDTPQAEQKGGA